MTKKNSTKRSLILSALSLLLCFSMLIGTTFAWFTDEVSSKNNIIKAGNLDVELEFAKVVDGQITNWETVNERDDVFDRNALWEPGRVEVVYLKVSNLGTLSLKYQLGVNVDAETVGETEKGEAVKLSEHLVFKVVDLTEEPTAAYTREEAIAAAGTVKGLKDYNGMTTKLDPKSDDPTVNDEDYVALIVYMPESVGNEANYRGDKIPAITLGINLFATQVEAEDDSFGTDYDEGANHEKFKVTNANDLQNAVNDAKPGDVIEIVNDLVLTEPIVIPAAPAKLSTKAADDGVIVIDLNGNTIKTAYAEGSTTNHVYAFTNNGNLLLKNGTVNARGIFNYGNMIVENATINAIDGNGGYAIRNYSGSTLTMNSGKIATTLEDDHLSDAGGYDATALRVDAGASAVINGGTIENICDFTSAIENYGTVEVNDAKITAIHTAV